MRKGRYEDLAGTCTIFKMKNMLVAWSWWNVSEEESQSSVEMALLDTRTSPPGISLCMRAPPSEAQKERVYRMKWPKWDLLQRMGRGRCCDRVTKHWEAGDKYLGNQHNRWYHFPQEIGRQVDCTDGTGYIKPFPILKGKGFLLTH